MFARNAFYMIFMFITTIASATNYYVSTTGNDTNSGSISLPYKTINYGITKLKAGDILYIRGGTYHERVTVNKSGTNTNRITISGLQGEIAVIDGKYDLPGGNVYNFLVSIPGSFVTLRDITIKNSSGGLLFLGGVYNYGINIIGNGSHESGMIAIGNYDLFDGCSMTDNGNGFGINGQTTWGSAFGIRGNNITVQNCISYNNKGEGFNAYSGSKGAIIQDNIAYDNDALQFYFDSSSGAIIQRNLAYCTVRQGHKPSWGIVIGGETGEPSDLQIINNLCYGNRTNLVTDSNVESATNWIIAFNTFMNARKTPEQIANGDNMGVYFYPSLVNFTNSVFKNNIVIEEAANQIPINNTLTNPHAGLTFSHNSWNKTPVASAHGISDVTGDPLLSRIGSTNAGELSADYFKLLSTSPVINKGETLTTVVNDFFRNSRNSLPDIGAIEYYYADPTVKVKEIIVTGSGDATILNVGELLQLNALVLPSNAANKKVSWSVTTGTENASITSSGLVTANKPGLVTLKALAQDGSDVFGLLDLIIVQRTETRNKMLIYPNPSQYFFNVKMGNPLPIQSLLKIANMSGKIVLENKIDPDITELQITFSFPDGIYIVLLCSQKQIYDCQKLIITN
jgi:hypothetical protein